MSDILKTSEAERPFPMDDGPNPCPPLTAGEYEALKRSIQEDGFIPAWPVVISAGPACEGQIIDGFHRSQVCAELGIEPVRIYHPCQTELEFKILQIKANLERRQMTTAQRALLAARLLPLYEERAKLRQKSAGLSNLGQSSQSSPATSCGTDEKGEARVLAAQAAGISHETLRQTRAILDSDKADELLEQIQSGAKSIKRAFESLKDVADSIKQEAQAERQIDELYFSGGTHADTRDAERERAVGDAIRLAMELDVLVRKHDIQPHDVAELRSRPHTFKGAARRLNEWLGAVEEVL